MSLRARPIARLPPAPEDPGSLLDGPGADPSFLFLDFDGTLAPIVEDPAAARPAPGIRESLRRLARHLPVAVISGRDLEDVRSRVGISGLAYAGSHGLDIALPDGGRVCRGEAHREALDRAERALRLAVEGPSGVEGARVERKRFSIAVHYRTVPRERVPGLIERVREVVSAEPRLRPERGKKVLELRPDIDWDKGKAVLHLLEASGASDRAGHVLYVGDDVTDEDAFRILEGRGIGVVVQGEDDARPSHADFRLPDPGALGRLLEALAERLDAGRDGTEPAGRTTTPSPEEP